MMPMLQGLVRRLPVGAPQAVTRPQGNGEVGPGVVVVVAHLEVGEPLEHLSDQRLVVGAGDPSGRRPDPRTRTGAGRGELWLLALPP